jgi:lipoprotein signal peptidase
MRSDGEVFTPPPRRVSRSRAFFAALRPHALLLVLFAADVATKLAAFRLLPEGQPVTVLPGLRLFLARNEWGVLGGVDGVGTVTANPAYTMILAVGLLLFAALVLCLSAFSIAFAWRLVAGAVVFLAIAFAAQSLAAPLAHIELPASLTVASIRVAVLAVGLAFYLASSAPFARAAFSLLAAGSLANAASFVYPPYAVIDFLVVPLDLFGVASGEDTVGVINLADVYLIAFPLLLVAWPVGAIARRMRSALG